MSTRSVWQGERRRGRTLDGATVVGGSMAAGAKDNYLAEFGAQLFTPNFSHL